MAAKTYPGKMWGNDQSNANDAPDWRYLNSVRGEKHLTGNATANVVATQHGWSVQLPWGPGGGPVEENLVAMGGLKGTALSLLSVQNQSGVVGHTATETVKVLLTLSAGVTFTTSNLANVFITAIGGNANTANLNLLYSAVDSDPAAGMLVFKAAPADLHLDIAGATLTINASSTFSGSGNVVTRGSALAWSGALVGANTVITLV